MNRLYQELKELEIEDFIWIIYSFIVIGALISNVFERDWLLSKKRKSRKTFKTINTVIFAVTFLIYFYFVLLSYKRLRESQHYGSLKEIFLNNINFLAACFFLIGGFFYLFTESASTTFSTSPSQII